jgi:hypothetical protein
VLQLAGALRLAAVLQPVGASQLAHLSANALAQPLASLVVQTFLRSSEAGKMQPIRQQPLRLCAAKTGAKKTFVS